MDRRQFTALTALSIAAPSVWIPSLAIAKNRRAGLVESVEVYSDLTAMYNSRQFATRVSTTEGVAGVSGGAIAKSVDRLRDNGFQNLTDTGCEVRIGKDAKRCTYPGFKSGYEEMQLPFYHANHRPRVGEEPWVALLDGPPVVSMSIAAEEIYNKFKDREFIRDLLYPRFYTSYQEATFERCNETRQYRLRCEQSTVVIVYGCRNRVPLGYANVEVFENRTEKSVFKSTVQFKV
jgi:hypothetical protein